MKVVFLMLGEEKSRKVVYERISSVIVEGENGAILHESFPDVNNENLTVLINWYKESLDVECKNNTLKIRAWEGK